jgi:hypothetical protein
MLRRVDWYVVSDVSEDCSAFVFTVKHSKKIVGLHDPEEGRITTSRHAGNYVSSDTA